jgi:hypothetical protein
MDKSTKDILLYGGVLAGVYFFVLKPILNKLGITDTARESGVDTSSPAFNAWTGSAFLNNYKGKQVTLLTDSAKKTLSQKIYNALPDIGNDDASTIIGIFRELRTKSQVADLVKYFLANYQYDLFSFLKKGRTKGYAWTYASGMSNDDIQTIIKIVSAKPLLTI